MHWTVNSTEHTKRLQDWSLSGGLGLRWENRRHSCVFDRDLMLHVASLQDFHSRLKNFQFSGVGVRFA